MSFEDFISKVLDRFCEGVSNAEDRVRVRNDREHGRYLAKVPGGSVIIARPSSLQATIRNGSHQWVTSF